MAIDTVSLRGRLASAGRAGRGAVRHLLRRPFPGLRSRGPAIEQLLLSPRDLRTADPSFASEIYHGHLGLAGAVAHTGTESPFAIAPPTPAWEIELHGFGWLRHLSAAGDEISREHARALVRDWLRMHGKSGAAAWQADLLARRIISWLSHSRIFLEGADQRFYESVMESLTRQVRHLQARYHDTIEGAPRLTALTALVLADLCTSESYDPTSRAVRLFLDELDRQIYADGGHIDRNPETLVRVLLDILPLRQCFVARDHTPPGRLIGAIDRIMPMIRFFRLGDGSLARFNGCGATPTDNLAAVLAHDDTFGQPVTLASQSGYCRLAAGSTAVIVDCGRPPPLDLSGRAHAGCLAFEMSTRNAPIIVNVGAPGQRHADWHTATRSTAAHSTVVMCDTSSSQLLPGQGADAANDTLLIGPENVTSSLETVDGAQVLRASHDGYDQRLGVNHARRISVSAMGETVHGEDLLIAPRGLKGEARVSGGAFAIRFHLHPDVSAQLSADGRIAFLVLADGDTWQLTARDEFPAIEESVFLADHRGPRKTQQVVITGTFGGQSERKVEWVIERSPAEIAAALRARAPESAPESSEEAELADSEPADETGGEPQDDTVPAEDTREDGDKPS